MLVKFRHRKQSFITNVPKSQRLEPRTSFCSNLVARKLKLFNHLYVVAVGREGFVATVDVR